MDYKEINIGLHNFHLWLTQYYRVVMVTLSIIWAIFVSVVFNPLNGDAYVFQGR